MCGKNNIENKNIGMERKFNFYINFVQINHLVSSVKFLWKFIFRNSVADTSGGKYNCLRYQREK